MSVFFLWWVLLAPDGGVEPPKRPDARVAPSGDAAAEPAGEPSDAELMDQLEFLENLELVHDLDLLMDEETPK